MIAGMEESGQNELNNCSNQCRGHYSFLNSDREVFRLLFKAISGYCYKRPHMPNAIILVHLEGSNVFEHRLQLALSVEGGDLIPAPDALAADKDARDAPRSRQAPHVILDLVHVGPVLNFDVLDVFISDLVLAQHLLRLLAKGAVALGNDQDLL